MRSLDRQAAFREAVHDLAAEPTPVNVRRYLAASALLELERIRASSPSRRSARSEAVTATCIVAADDSAI